MRFLWRLSLLFLLIIGGVSLVGAQDDKSTYEGQIAAPEFPAGVEWVNTNRPLTLAELHGKIVILDFWTYGCINCIHMIPVLKQIEDKYPNDMVIIGVHSAKFGPGEGKTENIRQIVARYNIHHPVINDKDFVVWSSFGVRAWPTFAVLDPRGNMVALQSGEIPFEAFDTYIEGMIRYYNGLGTKVMDHVALPSFINVSTSPANLLLFPGKVMVDPLTQRLFIADSNHNRIVIVDLATNTVTDVIGGGEAGLQDGTFETALFNTPQGMALHNEMLYVADTNNHAIRAVDLKTQLVTTVVGTGAMGQGLMPFEMVVSDPLGFDLRSPWDVAFDDAGILYIAMAGMHQVWQLDLTANTMQAVVGSGAEGQKNGAFDRSELAQPSGLFTHEGVLYIADAESSTIRAADLRDKSVQVIAGTTDNDLFDFGDTDGALGTNRLQHALGVTGDEHGVLYFADTYNNKIKRYDPTTSETTTVMGLGGTGGYRDGAVNVAQFDEPGGLAYFDGKLYVADTNNHAVRIIDLVTQTVSTLQISNPSMLQQDSTTVTVVGGNAASGDTLHLADATVQAGAGEIVLTYAIPRGFKLNPLAVSTIEVKKAEGDLAIFSQDSYTVDSTEMHLPVTFQAGTAPVTFTSTLFYCEATQEAFCLVDVVTLSVDVTATDSADTHAITMTRTVLPPAAYQSGTFGTTSIDQSSSK